MAVARETSPSRDQARSASKLAAAAAMSRISAPKDHSATPGTTVARCASFTSATSTPSMKTSTMPQGLIASSPRSTSAPAGGRRPSASGSSSHSMAARSKAGSASVVAKTSAASSGTSWSHSVDTAPHRLVARVWPCMSRPTSGKALASPNSTAAASVSASVASRP